MSEVPLYRRAYVGAYDLLGVEYDPHATGEIAFPVPQRCLAHKRMHPSKDHNRALGICLL